MQIDLSSDKLYLGPRLLTHTGHTCSLSQAWLLGAQKLTVILTPPLTPQHTYSCFSPLQFLNCTARCLASHLEAISSMGPEEGILMLFNPRHWVLEPSRAPSNSIDPRWPLRTINTVSCSARGNVMGQAELWLLGIIPLRD